MENHSERLSINKIKQKVIKSFISLIGRQILLRTISFLTINIILANILPVSTLGIFVIATSIITFFAFFSDIGLAASLIQKKDDINETDIKTTFTIQQVIIIGLSLLIFLLAPMIAAYYKIGEDGIWLIRSLGIGFFLTSLKVVPSVVLERNLNFQPLVFVEVVETAVFNILIIILTFNNLGLWAFSISAVARGVVGVVLIYLVSKVRVGIGFERESARKLVSFGLPFQINSILALVKDRLVPLVVAGIIGPEGIGYASWAQGIAWLSLEPMNAVIRISFPTFSRLQHDRVELGKAVEKSLFASCSMVYPLLFGIGAILPSVISHVFLHKYAPSIPSFYLFSVSVFFAVISTILTNTLNAIGEVKKTLKFMVFWTVLTWMLTPILTLQYGFIGIAISSFIISFTSILVIVVAKRILTINILRSIVLPAFSSLIMFGIVFFFSQNFLKDRITLLLSILLGMISYLTVMLMLGKNRIFAEIKAIRESYRGSRL